MLSLTKQMPFGVESFKASHIVGRGSPVSSGAISSTPPESSPMASKDALQNLWLIADKFREASDTLPIRWIQTFVWITQRQGADHLYQEKIAEAVGVPQGIMSKILKKMSDKGGLGLIHLERDTQDDRKKVITLTIKGKKLANDIQNILG
jgi:DNA-binding MarR family transcriptional regulator